MVTKDFQEKVSELIKSNIDLTESTIHLQEVVQDTYNKILFELENVKKVTYAIQKRFNAF